MQTDLTAYFDASGHQDNPEPIVVVAFVAPVKKWLQFELRWNAMLDSFEIPYLHMNDFAPKRNPPEDWPYLHLNADSRRGIQAAAIRIIKPINRIVAYHISPLVFREADRLYDFGGFWTGAYTVAASGCAQYVRRWTSQKYPGQPLKYFVEDGDEGQPRFRALVRGVGIQVVPLPKIDADTSKWFAPFQGTDFIAWEVARELAQADAPQRTRPTRTSMIEILRMLPQLEVREMQLGGLVSIAESFPVAFPKRDNDPSDPSGAADASV